MKKVYYVDEVRKMEILTCEQKQICENELMYQAGYVLAKDFLSRVMPNVDEEILVIANVGNNGGDALVVFQELSKLGYNTVLSIIGDLEKASDAFKYYSGKLDKNINLIAFNDIEKAIKRSKYIIDGIFGIGLKKDVLGDYKYVIKLINNSQKIIYSIDIPSGINPNTGEVMNIAVKASFTGVVGKYKLGNFLNDAPDYHGERKLLDIGLLEGYSDIYYLDYSEVDVKRKRTHNSYKYTYGHNAYIGSSSLPGAINLSALAALKSGSGLVEVFYDEEISRFNMETIYHKLTNDFDYRKYNTILFGPGITEIKEVYQNLMDNLLKEKIKLVIDAGGLKYLNLKKKYKNVVITPHLGELSQLIEVDKDLIRKDPILYLRQIANKGLITVLKGPTTIIQEQRYTYLMQAKNHGLATAGTGDVLAGIITSFLVDEMTINACVKANATFMIAADYARIKRGEVSMTATDVIDSLYKVWTRKR